MPKFSRMRLTKAATIKPDTWTNLVWDAVAAGDAGKVGQAYLMLGQTPFTVTLTATVEPANASDDVVRTRFIERQQKEGSWETTETYATAEHKLTQGSTWVVDTRAQRTPDKTRLVAQVHLKNGGTIKAADLSALYF